MNCKFVSMMLLFDWAEVWSTYMDLLDKEDSHERYKSEANDDTDHSFGECELCLGKVSVPVVVFVLVLFQNVLVQAVVGPNLEPQVYKERY